MSSKSWHYERARLLRIKELKRVNKIFNPYYFSNKQKEVNS